MIIFRFCCHLVYNYSIFLQIILHHTCQFGHTIALGWTYFKANLCVLKTKGHAHGVGVQRRFKICNAKYSARTVNLKGN